MTPVSLEIVQAGQGEVTRVEAEVPSALPTIVSTPSGRLGLHLQRITPAGGLRGCVACDHPELYTQRSFNRPVGIAIIVLAAVLAPFTWYLSLVAAALVDALLYRFAPRLVLCYVCGSRHCGFTEEPKHPGFDREIHERLKFGDRAVMGKPMREGGTADAPEPEH